MAVSGGLVAAVSVPTSAAEGRGTLQASRAELLLHAPPEKAAHLSTDGAVGSTVAMTLLPAELPTPVVAAAYDKPEEAPERDSTQARVQVRTAVAQDRGQTDSDGKKPAEKQAADASADQPASSSGAKIIAIAKKYTGTPYVYGGSTPSGFDCSGFTSYVFREAGISLPRTSRAQQAHATPVANPQPGDLAFRNFPATHVGIYVGNGMMIDSNQPGTTVTVRPVGPNITYGRVR